jgi:hypothetical protein
VFNLPDVSTVLWILGGLVLGLVVFRVGVAMLRGFTTPLPPPPPTGELRKVSLRYRCPTCGMELKVVVAGDELPEAPRHCMDEMDLVAPPVE